MAHSKEEADLLVLAQGWAKQMHKAQRRRYTDEPYFFHCHGVASRVAKKDDRAQMVCAAYLHDIIEDTECTEVMLRTSFGSEITNLVLEVTNVFTAEAFPYLKRHKRKQLEAERLGSISDDAKIIKLCDISDNISDIVDYDPVKASTYLAEKAYVLEKMIGG